PRGILGRPGSPVIVNGDAAAGPDLPFGDCQQKDVSIAAVADLASALDDAVHLEGHLQVHLHLARLAGDAITDGVPAPYRAGRRVDPHVKVIERDVPPGPFGGIAAPEGIGAGEDLV